MLVAASLSSQTFASDCAVALRAARSRATPAVCARRGAPDAVPADPAALLSAAGDAIERADFETANRLLDCADERVVGETGSPHSITLVRMRGNVLFREERIADALPYYECALSMSRAAGDANAEAIALNNLGGAWRRLGDPRRALEYLDRALSMQSTRSGRLYATTMMNYADLHRDLGDSEAAMRDYGVALAAFQAEGAHAGAAHVLEGMSAVSADAGATAETERYLQRALQAHRRSGHPSIYIPRTYAGLIKVALKAGRPDDAKRWADHALRFAARARMRIPAPVQIQIAEVERRSGRYDEAAARLQSSLRELSDKDPDRVAVLDALADLRERAGDPAGALERIKLARQLKAELDAAKQTQELRWLRIRVARDRAVQALEVTNERHRQRLRIVLWSAAAALILVVAGFLHRLWRARLREVARRAQHEADVAHYRKLAEALHVGRRVLQTALDSRDDALCVLDGSGRVLAANAGAIALLRLDAVALEGRALADALQEATREAWHALLDRLDDTGTVAFDLLPIGADAPVRAVLSDDARDEGVLLLRLAVAVDAISPDAPSVALGPTGEDRTMEADFRQALVELMLSSIEAWERSTGLNRIELAERSRIWRVSIDGGRLRARTLDRYLSLTKLPKHPHWRDVLRTAYFVLGQSEVDPTVRAGLQSQVDRVLGFTRRSAMV